MEIISMPRPMRWIWGSLGAYWLADIINPGFFSVAIMALLMIPVLVLDLYYPPEAEASKPDANLTQENSPEAAEDAAVLENPQAEDAATNAVSENTNSG